MSFGDRRGRGRAKRGPRPIALDRTLQIICVLLGSCVFDVRCAFRSIAKPGLRFGLCFWPPKIDKKTIPNRGAF